MTQPFTSDDSLPTAQLALGRDKLVEDRAESSSNLPNSEQPAIVHPNFDPKQTPLDPARPLSDIPEPARRVNGQLQQLYGKSMRFSQPNEDTLSKWQLMASESFAEHLALLSAATLIALPDSFYRRYHSQSAPPLLTALEQMTLLDMADIQRAIRHYPKLSRYGFTDSDRATVASITASSHANATANSGKKPNTLRALTKRYDPDELLSSLYADDWQVILQPQQFETGAGSLATDIMACSVAVHALKQCATRKSINHSYSAAQICQHLRSYLLSQICRAPAQRYPYRQIRLFTGHIIVAAYHLGWDIQVCDAGNCYFNISSRCSLLTRYANMQDYDINGWSS
ncbi:hypothetical protein [Psychrobacter sp. CAL346-MNA-CIBAN-0220]|uniref:hypothetical protein n=1 Tax=Psychrobacter sp. CAL346-MNA-CIBAN-0220 TaxID=3140457 RepID=UPI00331DC72F